MASQDKTPDGRRAACAKRAGAGLQSGAGGRDVVYDNNVLAGEKMFVRWRKGLLDIPQPLLSAEVSLR